MLAPELELAKVEADLADAEEVVGQDGNGNIEEDVGPDKTEIAPAGVPVNVALRKICVSDRNLAVAAVGGVVGVL